MYRLGALKGLYVIEPFLLHRPLPRTNVDETTDRSNACMRFKNAETKDAGSLEVVKVDSRSSVEANPGSESCRHGFCGERSMEGDAEHASPLSVCCREHSLGIAGKSYRHKLRSIKAGWVETSITPIKCIYEQWQQRNCPTCETKPANRSSNLASTTRCNDWV